MYKIEGNHEKYRKSQDIIRNIGNIMGLPGLMRGSALSAVYTSIGNNIIGINIGNNIIGINIGNSQDTNKNNFGGRSLHVCLNKYKHCWD